MPCFLMASSPLNWFDEKYRNGDTPTLADRGELLRESIDLPVPERLQEQIDRQIKHELFLFKGSRNYSHGLDTIICQLIIFGYMIGLKKTTLRGYCSEYEKILEGYRDDRSSNGEF